MCTSLVGLGPVAAVPARGEDPLRALLRIGAARQHLGEGGWGAWDSRNPIVPIEDKGEIGKSRLPSGSPVPPPRTPRSAPRSRGWPLPRSPCPAPAVPAPALALPAQRHMQARGRPPPGVLCGRASRGGPPGVTGRRTTPPGGPRGPPRAAGPGVCVWCV